MDNELWKRINYYVHEDSSLFVPSMDEKRYPDNGSPNIGLSVTYPSQLPERIMELYLKYFTKRMYPVICRIGTFCDRPSIILLVDEKDDMGDMEKKTAAIKEQLSFISSDIVAFTRPLGFEAKKKTLYVCIPDCLMEDAILRAYFVLWLAFEKPYRETDGMPPVFNGVYKMEKRWRPVYAAFMGQHDEDIGVLRHQPKRNGLKVVHVRIAADLFSFECLVGTPANDDTIEAFLTRLTEIKESYTKDLMERHKSGDWFSGMKVVTLAANDIFGYNRWKFVETKSVIV